MIGIWTQIDSQPSATQNLNDMKKTAIEQCIEEIQAEMVTLRKQRESEKGVERVNTSYRILAHHDAIGVLMRKLDIEREAIEQAFDAGREKDPLEQGATFRMPTYKTFNDYFTKRYTK